MKSEGIYDEATNAAIKEVLAWQLDQSMKEQKLTKVEMAKRLETCARAIRPNSGPQKYGRDAGCLKPRGDGIRKKTAFGAGLTRNDVRSRRAVQLFKLSIDSWST